MARKSNNSPTNILFSGQEKPVSKIISPSQIHKTTSQQILKPLMIDPSIKTSALTPIHFYKPQLISNLSVVTSSTPISFKAPCSPLPSAFARKTSFYDNLPAQLVASNSNTTVNPVKKESPLRMSIELTKQPIRST